MRQIGRVLGTDWLLGLLSRVNVEQVRKNVADVRSELAGSASAAQVAAELTRRKAIFSGSLGLAAGLLPPGINLAGGVADALASVVLQLELVYEIALAYGLDLGSDDRKGEALLVLAAALGSGRATGAGVQFVQKLAVERLSAAAIAQLARLVGLRVAEQVVLKGIPILGACVGAGANAAVTALVGNGANAFYAQIDSRAA